MRVIILLPPTVYSDFRGLYFSDDQILELVYQKKIPYASIIETENCYNLTMNSPRDPQDPIRLWKIEKEDLTRVLITDLADSVVLLDKDV